MGWLTRKEFPGPPELECAGRALAGELRTLFERTIAERSEREREREEREDWVMALRTGLFRVVSGFNVEVPEEFQMALLDRGDRMVFHAGDRKTLTLIYGNDCVVIESKSDYPRLPLPMSLRVWRGSGGDLRFRAVPDSPAFPKPIMTQAEFLSSVLRMACNRDFADGAKC